jgi:hypothetical protein
MEARLAGAPTPPEQVDHAARQSIAARKQSILATVEAISILFRVPLEPEQHLPFRPSGASGPD